MKRIKWTITFAIILVVQPLVAQMADHRPDPMTLEKFREITSSAGDNVPLQPMLAKVPWWSNAVTSCVATNFATDTGGKVSKLVLHQKARTVKGTYIAYSEAETDQNVVETYDERSSAYKFYFISGTKSLAEISTVYDFTNKTYSYTSTFDGMKVTGNGSYSNTNMAETSLTYSSNRLLVIDVQETEPVSPGATKPQH